MTDMTWISGGDRGRAFWRAFWEGMACPSMILDPQRKSYHQPVDPTSAWLRVARHMDTAAQQILPRARD